MPYRPKVERRVRPNVVFFDLETTGFDRPIRPVQIGAVDSWGENCFNEFVWPRRNVHPKAALTNNFYTSKGSLYRYGEELECLDLDAKVLLRNLEEFSIPYSDTIIGFSDSLLASRQLYTEAPSHRLSCMLYEVGLPVREEHDALADAEDCRRICKRMAGQCSYKFLDFIFDCNWFHDVDQQWDWTFPQGVVTV